MVAGIAEARGMEVQCCDEYEKLLLLASNPRIEIDNNVFPDATVVMVNCAKERRFLLETVQVLSDLNLSIKKAYFSFDAGCFMDVFHVTDKFGRKLTDKRIIAFIEQSLEAKFCTSRANEKRDFNVLELEGPDRPGLVSEIIAVLADLSCLVSDARFWTHNGRLAAILFIFDEISSKALDSQPHRISRIQHNLRRVLRGRAEIISLSIPDSERQLHKIMQLDRDSEPASSVTPAVNVQSSFQRGYSVVTVQCPDRPKLLFDIICTLTDIGYIVFHGSVRTEGDQSLHEFFIKHSNGSPIGSNAERHRVKNCLQAAVNRRGKGLKLEICSSKKQCNLPEITRVIRENGLLVKRAEICTHEHLASSVFYLTDTEGGIPSSEALASIRRDVRTGSITVEKKLPKVFKEKLQETESKEGAWDWMASRGSTVLRNITNLGLVRSFIQLIGK